MDRAPVSEAGDAGSIPAGTTTLKVLVFHWLRILERSVVSPLVVMDGLAGVWQDAWGDEPQRLSQGRGGLRV